MIVKGVNYLIRKWMAQVSAAPSTDFHPYGELVSSKEKIEFDKIYSEGLLLSSTPKSLWRRDRFLNLYNFAKEASKLEGAIAECGCWKGLSSFVVANAIKTHKENYQGENFIIVDSFEGLSKPSTLDVYLNTQIKGKFFSSLNSTKENLRNFPNLQFLKGWIPEVLVEIKENTYAFVHIDLDLAIPTMSAIKYFYPRLINRGIIVCDDYGSVHWEGMRNELFEYCKNEKIKNVMLSTGQLIIFKS
jgi:hypothetical protein